MFLRKFFRALLIFSLFLLTPAFAGAAELLLQSPYGYYFSGDDLILEVSLRVIDECINTVKAEIGFPQDKLALIDFSQAGSLLTVWPQPLTADLAAGRLSFSGGAPGGYCGRLKGDPGQSNLLLKLIFKVKEILATSTEEMAFTDNCQVFLNDKTGREASLSFRPLSLKFFPGPGYFAKQSWPSFLSADQLPPEDFQVILGAHQQIFQGKYFIVFSAVDKQSGLAFYQVSETKPGQRENWQTSTSPYLLQDQALKSIIKVRAVDKAGNVRTVQYEPKHRSWPYWLFIFLVIVLGILFALLKRIKKRRKNGLSFF